MVPRLVFIFDVLTAAFLLCLCLRWLYTPSLSTGLAFLVLPKSKLDWLTRKRKVPEDADDLLARLSNPARHLSASAPPSPVLAQPSQKHQVAIVIRGLIFKKSYTVRSSGKALLHSVDHDFLRSWPSMRHELVEPARRCGFAVQIFIAMHVKSWGRIKANRDYMTKLQAIDQNVSLRKYGDVPDTQFDVAKAFLKDFEPTASFYDLVIMTRDDFIYRRGSWKVLSKRYEHDKLNLVSTDCSQNVWDGLHVLPGAAVSKLARAIRGGSNAHDIIQRMHLSSSSHQVHFWFKENYGQPDRCEPAMGYLDRGKGQSFEDRNRLSAMHGNSCCASPHTEMDRIIMKRTRSCPILK